MRNCMAWVCPERVSGMSVCGSTSMRQCDGSWLSKMQKVLLSSEAVAFFKSPSGLNGGFPMSPTPTTAI